MDWSVKENKSAELENQIYYKSITEAFLFE